MISNFYISKMVLSIVHKFLHLLGILALFAAPTAAQTIQQNGTGNIIGNNNSVTIQREQTSIAIPKFEGQIQPVDPRQRDLPESELELKFNTFMLDNNGGIVYLDIWPYYTDEDLDQGFDPFEPLETFSVPEKSTLTGMEYVVRGHDSEDFFYDLRQSSRRIVGHFKIVGVSGPYQGYLAAVLVPLSMQDALLLKK